MQSKIEQSCFDFKIGFCDLRTGKFNESAYRKCIKTLTAMANKGRGKVGYVIAGVADKGEDVEKLKTSPSYVQPIEKNGYYVAGLDFDSERLGISSDRYFQKLIQILDKEPIDEKYKSYISNNIRFIDYGGKSVLIMKIEGLDIPAIYDNQYYQRKGANLDKFEPKDMGILFSRFNAI